MKQIIVGCGRLGAELARELSRRGHDITMIDKDPYKLQDVGRYVRVNTVEGVGFDQDVLTSAGIAQADGLAAVTDSDEANVVIAQVARQKYLVPRVVARIFDPRQAAIYARLGLQIISPTSWGVNRIADLLVYSMLDPVYSIASGQVELLRIELPLMMAGHKVMELTVPGESTVVAITRRGKAFLPTLGTLFEEGDVVHLSVVNSFMGRLSSILMLE